MAHNLYLHYYEFVNERGMRVMTVLKYPDMTLDQLISKKDKALFMPKFKHVFNNKLKDYIYQCDLSLGQSLVECALVYGYPLDVAKEYC